jgi:hypothetical protein
MSIKQSVHSLFFKAKVAVQADIDCIAELADFLRFNSHYAKVIMFQTLKYCSMVPSRKEICLDVVHSSVIADKYPTECF